MKKNIIFSLIFTVMMLVSTNLLFMRPEVFDWYNQLIQPPYTPPKYLFGPAWTSIYLMMGYSYWNLRSLTTLKDKSRAFLFFYLQLFFNFIWSGLFFTLKLPLVAFIDLTLLWIFVLLMIVELKKINKTSFFLMLPYFTWITYAVYLNLGFLILNFD